MKIPKVGKRGWCGVAIVIIGAICSVQGLNNPRDDFDVALAGSPHGHRIFDVTSRSEDLYTGWSALAVGGWLILFGYLVKTKGFKPPWERE